MTTLPAFVRVDGGFADILLRVTPKSSRDAIEGVEVRDDGQPRLKMRVRAVPEKGKANKAVIELLAKSLGLPKSALELAGGETSRDKTVRIGLQDGVLQALSKLG